MSDNVKSGLFNVLRRWTLVISKQVEADIKTYLQLLLDPGNALSLSLPAHYCAIWMSLPFSSSSVVPLSFVLPSLILFEFFSCRCYLFASLPHPSVCVPPPRISHLSILSCNPSPLSAAHPSPFVCFMHPRSLQCHSFDSFFFSWIYSGMACLLWAQFLAAYKLLHSNPGASWRFLHIWHVLFTKYIHSFQKARTLCKTCKSFQSYKGHLEVLLHLQQHAWRKLKAEQLKTTKSHGHTCCFWGAIFFIEDTSLLPCITAAWLCSEFMCLKFLFSFRFTLYTVCILHLKLSLFAFMITCFTVPWYFTGVPLFLGYTQISD